MALLLGACLSAGGFARVYLSTHDLVSATAITASLLFIVVTSECFPVRLVSLSVCLLAAQTSGHVVSDRLDRLMRGLLLQALSSAQSCRMAWQR